MLPESSWNNCPSDKLSVTDILHLSNEELRKLREDCGTPPSSWKESNNWEIRDAQQAVKSLESILDDCIRNPLMSIRPDIIKPFIIVASKDPNNASFIEKVRGFFWIWEEWHIPTNKINSKEAPKLLKPGEEFEHITLSDGNTLIMIVDNRKWARNDWYNAIVVDNQRVDLKVYHSLRGIIEIQFSRGDNDFTYIKTWMRRTLVLVWSWGEKIVYWGPIPDLINGLLDGYRRDAFLY